MPIGDFLSEDLMADLRDETEDLFINLLQVEAIVARDRRKKPEK